ncbi:Hypothetical protein PHPALM_11 [Phytophthora palmivora]|uniref:Uncharacterized protein n=1 Tax=Phytophthora palmivora TaxID=4796 RepID=A0A2P4YVW7_9STRA|nr:Hypothetical protein PHPALM_11 [Phytophthora palmivora]
MVEPSSPECVVQIIKDEKLKRADSEFKPLTSGQLLLKTRRRSDHRRALLNDDDGQDDEDEGRECFLSKFLAVSMTLLVCGFIYFAVLQSWLLES